MLVKNTLGDYHNYPIRGVDSNGDIECDRRYSLFYELRLALVMKYPGLYVPPLPEKKLTGKKEEFTLIERQHFLNLFCRECANLKYIAQSLELHTFLTCTPEECSKKLQRLQRKPKTIDRLALYSKCLGLQPVSSLVFSLPLDKRRT